MKDSHMNTPQLAARLGLHRAGREWRGSCPACGYGSDAASLSTGKNGKPLLWCASCQDNEALVAVLRGAGSGTDFTRHDDHTGTENALAARQKAQERARVIWNGASPVTPNDPAGRYLARRGLMHLTDNPGLRYREDVPHPSGGRHHALAALVQDAAGKALGVHRTYLAADGTKARVEPPKASLGPVWGGAIRFTPVARHIVIGEGIETSASAGLMLGLPAWAAISAGNLAKGVVLPAEIREVTIAADDDGVNAQGRNPGLEAAEQAAARWQAEGRKVRIIKPNMPGKDFNNILQARAAGKAIAR